MVGAPTPSEPGLFYQWGDIIGHSVADGYDFSFSNYRAKNLNLITDNLDNENDAARAYYGPKAKMPSAAQFQELIEHCVIATHEDGLSVITSNINGNSITIRGNGHMSNLEHVGSSRIRVWSSSFASETNAMSFHGEGSVMSVDSTARTYGYNIMAVHS